VLRLQRLAAGLVVAFAGGCTVGPDFHRPPAPAGVGYTAAPFVKETAAAAVAGGAAQYFLTGLDIPGEWWRLFHSKALDKLVQEALVANPTAAAAHAALVRADEQVLAAEGAFYPQVSTDFSASRNKTAASQSPVPANNELYYSLYVPQVTVSYTADVFGGTRREVESLAASAEVKRFALEATYLSLTSNVIAAAIAEAALRGELDARRKVVSIGKEALAILHRQYQLGQIAGTDVAAQEAQLANDETTLPPVEKSLSRERDRLTALVGRFPNEPPAERFELASLQLPTQLPVSLPSIFVRHRPDVRAAEAELHAASAEAGVAVAARLPQFTLTGNTGSTALTFGGIGAAGNVFWSIAGDVAQPIFEGFALLHKQRAAEAAFAEARARYRKTVLDAFRDVADVLQALELDADELTAAVLAEAAAKTSLDIVRQQLQLGQINYLGLLTAERAYTRARLALVQAQASRYADTAALFEALGGGWWHRRDVLPLARALRTNSDPF
jgi:NodT family efflux transporter outer membrane factor (OMF) lipoprotein